MNREDCESLRALAAQCRSLARGVSTPDVAASLTMMAADYEKQAAEAEAAAEVPQAGPVNVPPPAQAG